MAPTFLHGFDSISARAAGSLLASVWQGALLAGCVAVCLLALRGLSAAVRSVVWTAVLLLVVALPLLPLMRGRSVPAVPMHTPELHLDPRWSLAVAAVWLTFSALRLAQLAASAWRLHGLRCSAVRVSASDEVMKLLSAGRRSAELCISREVDRPSVVGFFRPRVILPEDLLARTSEAELQQIVLHEMEHLRRRDDWTNLLQKLALAVFPLNPVLFWLDRRLCLERELACDDGVLRATQARKAYALCLTNLAEQSMMRRGLSLALGAVGSWKPQSEVGRRVVRILRKPDAVMGRAQSRLAAGALLAGTLAGTVLLGHSPQLVSFLPQASPVQAAAIVPTAVKHVEAAQAAVVTYAPRSAHAIAVKATMAAPSVGTKKAVAALCKRQPARPHVLRARAEVQPQYGPREVLAAWQPDASPAHLGLLLLHDSQFRYAAVPVRDGWLVIQL